MKIANDSLIVRFLLFAFLFTTASASLIQLVILPYAFPSWHANDGLMASCYDSVYYHKVAINKADAIRRLGWGQWELRPERSAPAGIASALYAVVAPKPWALIPLNALLHALSATILMIILLNICKEPTAAFCGALPFLFFPSASLWYSQILKDGYFCAGVMCILLGITHLTRCRRDQLPAADTVLAFIALAGGVVFIWMVRPMFALPMLAVSIAISCAAYCLTILHARLLRIAAVVSFIVYALVAVDSMHMKIEKWRLGYAGTPGNTNIDVALQLNTTADILRYSPRSLQIGMFAPFPSQWMGKGSEESNTYLRKVTGFEMVIVYCALLFLPYSFLLWRRNSVLWVTVFFCAIHLIFFSMIVCNIGTLCRFRYSFLMVLVGLGCAGWAALAQKSKSKCYGRASC